MTGIEKSSVSLSEKIETVLLKGDLSVLNDQERLNYYHKVCESVGLNPLTKPFDYLLLNNKLVLYATKACTDQLRFVHKISIQIVARDKVGDVYVVTARAIDPKGRTDESTGAVAIGRMQGGDALANAYMKAETKAKRRVTLSICGLGLLDETEVESIPGAQRAPTESPKPVAQIATRAEVLQPIDEKVFENDETATREVVPMEQPLSPSLFPTDLGDTVITFGKKFSGKKFKDVLPEHLQSYIEWMRKDGKVSRPGQDFIDQVEAYLSEKSKPKEEEFKEQEFEDIPF